MPFKRDKTETKAIILIIADSFEEEIDIDDASKIIVATADIAPMEYLECFYELVDNGMIYLRQNGSQKLCALTEIGSATAESIRETFRHINTEQLLARAGAEYDRVVEGKTYSVWLSEDEQGFYVNYLYSRKGVERSRLSVFFSSREKAKRAISFLESDPAYFNTFLMTYLDREGF